MLKDDFSVLRSLSPEKAVVHVFAHLTLNNLHEESRKAGKTKHDMKSATYEMEDYRRLAEKTCPPGLVDIVTDGLWQMELRMRENRRICEQSVNELGYSII
jgi:hypothetical protein